MCGRPRRLIFAWNARRQLKSSPAVDPAGRELLDLGDLDRLIVDLDIREILSGNTGFANLASDLLCCAMPKARRPYQAYSSELADEVCALVAEGKSLRQITELPGMPSRRAVQYWMSRNPDFREKYECAMMLLGEFWAHEIIEIADDSSGDFIITEDGRRAVDHENINRSRLKVDSRKWLLSKILPSRYGDRVQADVNVGVSPEALRAMPPEKQKERVLELLAYAATLQPPQHGAPVETETIEADTGDVGDGGQS